MVDFIKYLENKIESSADRYRSIIGIPVSTNGIIAGIESVLSVLKENSSLDNSSLSNFLMHKFGISRNTAINIGPTLERANILLRSMRKYYKVTNVGKKYLEQKNSIYLGKGFLENYYGFFESILIISNYEPKNQKEILNKWISLYENQFGERKYNSHVSQLNITIRYLKSFGFIDDNLTVNEHRVRQIDGIDIL